MNLGDSFSYQVQASHDEGLSLKYSLKNAPSGMTINGFGLVSIENVAAPSPMTFEVVVRDTNGVEAKQANSVIVCSPPTFWDVNINACHSPITYTSWPEQGAYDDGLPFSYQVTAEHEQGLSMTYSLGEKPAGMTITPEGLVSMDAVPSVDTLEFEVIATDSNGFQEKQGIAVTVCKAPNRWDGGFEQCRSPAITITSSLPEPAGLNDGTLFSYQVTATHTDVLPLSYSLSRQGENELFGMKIDSNGLVTWKPQGYQYGVETFGVIVTDTLGGKVQQDIYLTICGGDYRWNAETGGCDYLQDQAEASKTAARFSAKSEVKNVRLATRNYLISRRMQSRFDGVKTIKRKISK